MRTLVSSKQRSTTSNEGPMRTFRKFREGRLALLLARIWQVSSNILNLWHFFPVSCKSNGYQTRETPQDPKHT